jgi:hypothetical protein
VRAWCYQLLTVNTTACHEQDSTLRKHHLVREVIVQGRDIYLMFCVLVIILTSRAPETSASLWNKTLICVCPIFHMGASCFLETVSSVTVFSSESCQQCHGWVRLSDIGTQTNLNWREFVYCTCSDNLCHRTNLRAEGWLVYKNTKRPTDSSKFETSLLTPHAQHVWTTERPSSRPDYHPSKVLIVKNCCKTAYKNLEEMYKTHKAIKKYVGCYLIFTHAYVLMGHAVA